MKQIVPEAQLGWLAKVADKEGRIISKFQNYYVLEDGTKVAKDEPTLIIKASWADDNKLAPLIGLAKDYIEKVKRADLTNQQVVSYLVKTGASVGDAFSALFQLREVEKGVAEIWNTRSENERYHMLEFMPYNDNQKRQMASMKWNELPLDARREVDRRVMQDYDYPELGKPKPIVGKGDEAWTADSKGAYNPVSAKRKETKKALLDKSWVDEMNVELKKSGLSQIIKPLPSESMEACMSYVKREHSDWSQDQRVAACMSATGQSKHKSEVTKATRVWINEENKSSATKESALKEARKIANYPIEKIKLQLANEGFSREDIDYAIKNLFAHIVQIRESELEKGYSNIYTTLREYLARVKEPTPDDFANYASSQGINREVALRFFSSAIQGGMVTPLQQIYRVEKSLGDIAREVAVTAGNVATGAPVLYKKPATKKPKKQEQTKSIPMFEIGQKPVTATNIQALQFYNAMKSWERANYLDALGFNGELLGKVEYEKLPTNVAEAIDLAFVRKIPSIEDAVRELHEQNPNIQSSEALTILRALGYDAHEAQEAIFRLFNRSEKQANFLFEK